MKSKKTIKTKSGRYRIVKDNKMRDLGDTDLEKKVIRINKKRNKKVGKGELLDTILHEKLHADHPKAKEKTVRKMTKKKKPLLGNVTKSRLYGTMASV